MKKTLLTMQGKKSTVTPEEYAYNKWFNQEMKRLGLEIGFDEKTEFKPFNSEIEYERAKEEAYKYLVNKQPVPKDLEEKLLIAKQNLSIVKKKK